MRRSELIAGHVTRSGRILKRSDLLITSAIIIGMAHLPVPVIAQSSTGNDNTDWTHDDSWSVVPFPNDSAAIAIIDSDRATNQPTVNSDVEVAQTDVDSGTLTIDAQLTSPQVNISPDGTITVTPQGVIAGYVDTGGNVENIGMVTGSALAGVSVSGGILANRQTVNGAATMTGTGPLTNLADLNGGAHVGGNGVLTSAATLNGDVVVTENGRLNNPAGRTAHALTNSDATSNLGALTGEVKGSLQNTGATRMLIDNDLAGLSAIIQQSSAAVAIAHDTPVTLGAGIASAGQFVLLGDAVVNGQPGSQFANTIGRTLSVSSGARLGMALDNAFGATADISRMLGGNGANLGRVNLPGRVQGNFTNLNSENSFGTLVASGSAGSVSGLLRNAGQISLTTNEATTFRLGSLEQTASGVLDIQNNLAGDRLVIAGNADMQDRVLFDVDISDTGTAFDRIDVGGRLTMSDVVLSFSNVGDNASLAGPYPVLTLGDLGPVFFTTEGQIGSFAVPYQVVNTGNALELRSGANPALAGLASNISLTQSLIVSVVNRPSSAFVAGLAAPGEDTCGSGGNGIRSNGAWMRSMGGFADATGNVTTSLGSFDNDFNIDYSGFQAGLDRGCAESEVGGFDVKHGVLAGMTYGGTEQPVFDFNPATGQVDTSRLLSTNITDLQQHYAGIYLTAAQDRLFGDMQLRVDHSSFDLRNMIAQSGSGLGVDGQTYASTGATISGSVGYAIALDTERGIAMIPTVGFAYSDASMDPITFSGGRILEVDDVRSSVNFVSPTMARASA